MVFDYTESDGATFLSAGSVTIQSHVRNAAPGSTGGHQEVRRYFEEQYG